MRFEKVSYKKFYENKKTLIPDKNVICDYNAVQLPKRATKSAAGYDFVCPYDLTFRPGELIKVNTGIKCNFEGNDSFHLEIHLRSSMGIKRGFALANGTGIIDADYYNNENNEGDIIIALRNMTSTNQTIRFGERIAQGIFVIHGLVVGDDADGERKGGVGSTGV